MFNLLLLALVACGEKEATTETTAQNETTEQTETTDNDGTPIVQELPEGSYPATEEVSLIAPDGDTTTTGVTLDKIQKDLDHTIKTVDEIKEILNDNTTDTTDTKTENNQGDQQ